MTSFPRRVALRALQDVRLLRAHGRARTRPAETVREPEIHVFLLWSNAIPEAPRILADIERQLVVHEVVRVSWPAAEFSWNLTRFYGGRLPPRAEKELHCGTDPFLVVVVEDREPVYAPRRSPKGIANTRMFDAKQRYRAWTGGGHRVHASDDRVEAEHDLFLLLGRTSASYAGGPTAWSGQVAEWQQAMAGANGWRDAAELEYAISTATECVRAESDEPATLALVVRDPVRAALTANVFAESPQAVARHQVLVGERPAILELRRAPRRKGRRRREALALRARNLVERAHQPVAAILVYHRIGDAAEDPFRICVSPATFAGQLDAIRSRYDVIALDRFLDAFPHSVSGRPVVIVTFDDGYADTLQTAHPIAAAAGSPITAFVTLDPVLAGEPFWWDELGALVLAARERPLAVEIGGRRHVSRVSSRDERLQTCRDLHRLLRPLHVSQRRTVLDRLAAQVDGAAAPPVGVPLTIDELRELDALPEVAVGAHTLSHAALAMLPRAEQVEEIEGSKRRLSELLGREVDLFAYPYGRGADLSAETTRIAAGVGFRAACTTVQAPVTRRTRTHALPRLTVYESSPAELLRRVQKLLRDR